MRRAIGGLAVALVVAAAASAETRRFEIAVAGDTVTCRQVSRDRSPARKLQVEVTVAGSGEGRSFELQSDRRAQKVALRKVDSVWSLETPIDKLVDANGNSEEFRLTTKVAGGPSIDCGKPFRPFDISSGARGQARDGIAQRRQAPPFDPKTRFLVHLPTGAPAPPFPESIPESAFIQVVAIMKSGDSHPGVEFTVCPDRELFRIRGGFGTKGEEEDDARSMAEGVDEYVEVPVGPVVRCGAGTVSYTLRYGQTGGGDAVEKTTSLRIRPIHHLSASFLYGFDLAKVQSFEKQGGKIVALEDRAGPALRVGFTWHPLGLDLEDMKGHNRLFNPVVSFDPRAPTENFVVGNAFTWSGGISVIVGGSFRKRTVLNGMNPGDDIDDTTAIPTRSVWNKDSRDWYLGFVVDQNVLRGIKGLVATVGK